ncbi:MAG: hypothetical protein R6T92_04790 [Desulfosalsimonadaceae bacterium]
MKKRIFARCLLSVFFLAVVLGGSVYASSLRDADIKNFISSMKEVQMAEEEYDDLDEFVDDEDFSEEDMEMPDNPMSESIKALRGHEIYGRLDGIAKDHGFSDATHWASVGDRVLKAFFSILLEEEEPAMREEMERSLREIDENPHMSDAQKQEMKQMMKNAMSSMDAMADAPAEDVDAVRPHMGELRQVLEGEE